MASLLFGDAIDYARVHIFNRRYLPWVQPKTCAMTPNGSIYFHHSCFLDDYSQATIVGPHRFMEEMVRSLRTNNPGALHKTPFVSLSHERRKH